MALFLAAGLSLFIPGCASVCAPRATPNDTDPRIVQEKTARNIWSDNLLSLEFLSFFCTKNY
jgi:hypothetical protein